MTGRMAPEHGLPALDGVPSRVGAGVEGAETRCVDKSDAFGGQNVAPTVKWETTEVWAPPHPGQ